MSKKTEEANFEAVARAMLSYCEREESSTGYKLRLCSGPTPCFKDRPCVCTRNLYGLARAAIAASKSHAAHAKSLKGKR